MPDGWEIKYGLNPLDPGDALLDSDSDCAMAESLAEVAVPNAGGLAGCGSSAAH